MKKFARPTPDFTAGQNLKQYLVNDIFNPRDKGFILIASSEEKAVKKLIAGLSQIGSKHPGKILPGFSIQCIGIHSHLVN